MNDKKTTNWDEYYRRPYRTASVTRKITGHVLIKTIRKFAAKSPLKIFELGGGNSCFLDLLYRKLSLSEYHVLDNNRLSLDLMQKKQIGGLVLHDFDALNPEEGLRDQADLVFSAGLIEHFLPEGTAQIIETHFQMAKPGGLVLMTFPTPTFLYRLTRRLAELLGLWIFHDERPLQLGEVLGVGGNYGTILYARVIWSIFLTQGIVVFRKNNLEIETL